ncbi:hypothetical protein BHE74_00043251 [Ensete ventricosum]|nr:hypothetical protein GW17_00051615 [Ensete ventricosum]RWW50477.1 hypothetical protein BHE74_00043251 [Ensete ventricosum]
MSHSNELTSMCKVAFVIWRHDSAIPTSGVLQVGWPVTFSSAMPPVACCQGCCRLVDLSRPLCHAASHAAALLATRCQVCYGSIEIPDLPVDLTKVRSASNVRSTWQHCDMAKRHGRSGGCRVLVLVDLSLFIILSPSQKSFLLCPYGEYLEMIVAVLRSLKYVVGELIDFGVVACYSWVGCFGRFGLTMVEMRDLGMTRLVVAEMCNLGAIGLMVATQAQLD